MENPDREQLHDVINALERERKRVANKPFIDHLVDAISIKDGKPHLLQTVGMRIIIERVASVLPNSPWLDTRSYIIRSIDSETGNLKLWDEELEHHASANFITSIALGYRFKIPALSKGHVVLKRKVEPQLDNEGNVIVKPIKVAAKVASSSTKEIERRIYATRGIVHTRNKGVAYVPEGESKATDGMRLTTLMVGTNLRVKSTTDGWEEVWVPSADL
jgi:hypothetical protein